MTSLTFSYRLRLIIITLLLCGIGLISVFEASATESLDTYGDKYTMVCNHAQWLGLGLIVLAVAQAIPTKYYQEFSPLIYFVGLIGLIAVLIPNFGVTVNGATRWLAIGSFRFQPAELMKLG